METPVLILGAVVGLIGLAALLVAFLGARTTSRKELAAARAETAALRHRIDELDERLEETSTALVETQESYLITDAGSVSEEPAVPERVVLSATFGEPLVKIVALGHGVGRALSAESRNRIRFEMRREVRRARKQRRREMKDAWRASRSGAPRAPGKDAEANAA